MCKDFNIMKEKRKKKKHIEIVNFFILYVQKTSA